MPAAFARLGIDIRPGEATAALFLFTYFFLIIAFQYACKSVRQAEYLDRLGAEALPLVYFLVALCSLPVLAVYVRFCDRMPLHHLIATTSLLVSSSVVGFWWLLERKGGWAPVAFYVWISIVFVLNVSQFWSYANHVFDARQAKRLFGFVGAGGLLGSVAGGQITAFGARTVGVRFSLLVAAAVLAATAGLIYVIHAANRSRIPTNVSTPGTSKIADARGGWKVIRGSRHLRLITVTMLVTVVVAQIVDLQFNSAVERSTTTKEQSAALFGNFYTIMGLAAFAFQLLFTSRIHRALGIGVALRTLPMTMGIGTVAVLVSAAGFPVLLLPAAMGLKVAENGIRYSLDQATRELLFMPVRSDVRVKAKATIDVFVQRFGKGAAALLLLPVTLGWLPALQVGWIALALIVVWLVVAGAMQREYVRTFRSGLRDATMVDSSPVDLQDATTIEMLVQSLDSDDPRQVLTSLELLAYHDKGNLVPRLLVLHDDPGVRIRTLQILAAERRREAATVVERAMGDPDLSVRVEATRTLAAILGEDAAHLMEHRLDDPDPRVRSAVIAAIGANGRAERRAEVERSLERLLGDADPESRVEAAKALGALSDSVFETQMVRLLLDDDRRVARQAMLAVASRLSRGRFNPVYGPLLVSRVRDRRLKHDARNALVACGPDVIPALVHFMNDPEENPRVRRALPRTVARIGSPAAVEALLVALEAPDGFLRRKAADALIELKDRGALRPLPRRELERRVLDETARYLRHFADLRALGLDGAAMQGPLIRWETRAPSLLHELLSDRMRAQIDQIFALLGLLHDRRDMDAARHGLIGADPLRRTHALEYLDNTLEDDVGRAVVVALGDSTARERSDRARRAFGIASEGSDETLRRLLTSRVAGDGEAGWIAAAALHAIHVLRVAALEPLVREAATRDSDPLVRETADWILRVSAGSKGSLERSNTGWTDPPPR
jgi:AAA family ATP:ADP antiporter